MRLTVVDQGARGGLGVVLEGPPDLDDQPAGLEPLQHLLRHRQRQVLGGGEHGGDCVRD